MGCYGIGVGRAIAAVVEQKHDDKGIVWPTSIAPFEVILIPLMLKDQDSMAKVMQLYDEFNEHGIDVLIDDRPISAGVKFKDAELIGIPHQLVFGKLFKENNNVEYVNRLSFDKSSVKFNQCVNMILDIIKKEKI